MNRFICGLLCGAVWAAAAGCGGSSTPTTPSGPTPTLVTETFSGVVTQGGQSFHPISVTSNGLDVSVHLTSAGPPATIFMLLSIGAVVGGECVPVANGSVLAQGAAAAQLVGSIDAGSYCVSVADAGNQIQDVAYAVIVNHF